MNPFTSKDIVVLDVTSRLMSVMVGCKKAQSVYDVKASVDREYAGFCDGEWLDESETVSVAEEVLTEAMKTSLSRSKRLFIGVPAEFVTVVNKPVSITLDRVRRIIDADIDYLLKRATLLPKAISKSSTLPQSAIPSIRLTNSISTCAVW